MSSPKNPSAEKTQMLIANRLRDGLTVFRSADRRWVEDIASGRVVHGDEQARELLAEGEAEARNNVVIGPYLIDIAETDGQRRPLAWREAIRAFGPTVETGRTA
jgi:hypothetical protein